MQNSTCNPVMFEQQDEKQPSIHTYIHTIQNIKQLSTLAMYRLYEQTMYCQFLCNVLLY